MRNRGKTTTAGMLYKKLKPKAKDAHLFGVYGKELANDHPLIENGKPIDFVAHLEMGDKKVVIISMGDCPKYLEEKIDLFIDKVNYLVCCLRTQNRAGSARKMLLTKYANYPKEEFWTVHSEDITEMYLVKQGVVDRIEARIMSN